MKAFFAILAFSWTSLWLTPDQQGERLFEKGQFADAAERFEDPMWKATALYRAGEFKEAQSVFARIATAEAEFNRGNCLVFLGKYEEAVTRYELALEKKPGWKEAAENRDLAAARAEMLKSEGGDMGDQKIGADKIVFDKKKEGGQETTLDEGGEKGPTREAMWLRRVQTQPADFLRNKFAYQHQMEGGEEP